MKFFCPACKTVCANPSQIDVLSRSFWKTEEGKRILDLPYVTKQHWRCGECGSLERHRLLVCFLDERMGLVRNKRVLEIGPCFLTRRLFSGVPVDHVTVDIPGTPLVTFDCGIENLSTAPFDLIVCSHVLEHVRGDDIEVMRKIISLLKSGGTALFQVPIWSDVTRSFEPNQDLELLSGNNDHVRRYGPDFVERLAFAGFRVRTFQPSEYDVERYGLDRAEKIYMGM